MAGWTQSDLDALEMAIKTGVKRVRYASGETEYQSVDDMLKLRAIMKGEIAATSGNGGGFIAAGRIEC